MNVKKQEPFEIDFLRIGKFLLRYIWLIILVGVIFAGMGYGYARFFKTPLYASETLVYVNNQTVDLGGTQVNVNSDLDNVDSYLVILQSRTTLEQVIEKLNLPISYEALRNMVSAYSVNQTKIFRIVVTDADPERAALIANTITDVLSDTLNSIISNRTVRVVDYATPNHNRVAPSYSKYAMYGLILGALLMSLILALIDLTDRTVHNENELSQHYTDVPILAMIPDLRAHSSGKYGKYSKYGKYKSYGGYEYGYGYGSSSHEKKASGQKEGGR